MTTSMLLLYALLFGVMGVSAVLGFSWFRIASRAVGAVSDEAFERASFAVAAFVVALVTVLIETSALSRSLLELVGVGLLILGLGAFVFGVAGWTRRPGGTVAALTAIVGAAFLVAQVIALIEPAARSRALLELVGAGLLGLGLGALAVRRAGWNQRLGSNVFALTAIVGAIALLLVGAGRAARHLP